MSLLKQAFNRLKGRIQDTLTNPAQETYMHSSAFNYPGEQAHERAREHMESRRNIDGTWHLVKHTFSINMRDLDASPEWKAEVINEELEFDAARDYLRAYESRMKKTGAASFSLEDDNYGHIHAVDRRLQQTGPRRPAPQRQGL